MRALTTRAVGWIALVGSVALLGGHARAGTYDAEIARIGKELAESLNVGGRRRVATVDFVDLQGQATELGRFLAEELSTQLVMSMGGKSFAVVDRAHLRAIIQEHGFTVSGLVNPATTKKLGEISGIDTLITGSVTPFQDSVRITVKAIATDTAQIVSGAAGDLAKTEVIKELLAREVSSPYPSAQGAAGEPPVPSWENAYLRVRLKQMSKSPDGMRASVVVGITNKSDKDIELGYDYASSQLTDDSATQWMTDRVSGVAVVHRDFDTKTTFAPGAEQVVTFTFNAPAVGHGRVMGSTGRVFALASTFRSRIDEQYGKVSIGLSGMSAR